MSLFIVRFICGCLGAFFLLVLATNLWTLLLNLIYRETPAGETYVFLVLSAVILFTCWKVGTLSAEQLSAVGDALLTFYRAHKYWLIGCAVASGVGLLTLGAPGFLVLVMDYIVEPLIAKPLGWRTPRGDTTWPFLIFNALHAPWFIFGLHLLTKKFWTTATTSQSSSVVTVLSVILFFLIQLLYRFANR